MMLSKTQIKARFYLGGSPLKYSKLLFPDKTVYSKNSPSETNFLVEFESPQTLIIIVATFIFLRKVSQNIKWKISTTPCTIDLRYFILLMFYSKLNRNEPKNGMAALLTTNLCPIYPYYMDMCASFCS